MLRRVPPKLVEVPRLPVLRSSLLRRVDKAVGLHLCWRCGEWSHQAGPCREVPPGLMGKLTVLVESLQPFGKPVGMGAFGLSKGFEPLGHFFEPLLPSGLSHPRIHLGVFIRFTFYGSLEVGFGEMAEWSGQTLS